MKNTINFQKSIIILIIFIGFTFLTGIPLILISQYFEISFFGKDEANLLAYFFPLIFTILLSYKLYVKGDGKEKIKISKYLNFNIGSLNKYPYIIILSLIMMFWVDFFTSFIPMPEWIRELFEDAINLSIPSIITVTIFAPLLEEILVRGLVLPGFVNKYGVKKAIVLSAVFFGLIHLNPWQFIGGFVSGLFLGYLFIKSHSLSASIFVHFFNNSLSILILMFLGDIDTSLSELTGELNYYIILGLSIPVGYVIFKKLDKTLNNEYTINDEISNSNQ